MTSSISGRELDRHEARRLLPGLGPGQHQQRLGQAAEALGLALDVGQEAVARLDVLLRAGLQHLDGAADGGERRAQLVGRVGHELALDPLATLALGEVRDDEQRQVGLRPGGDADEAEGALLVDPHLALLQTARPGRTGCGRARAARAAAARPRRARRPPRPPPARAAVRRGRSRRPPAAAGRRRRRLPAVGASSWRSRSRSDSRAANECLRRSRIRSMVRASSPSSSRKRGRRATSKFPPSMAAAAFAIPRRRAAIRVATTIPTRIASAVAHRAASTILSRTMPSSATMSGRTA